MSEKIGNFQLVTVDNKEEVRQAIADCLASNKGFIFVDEHFNGYFVNPSKVYKCGMGARGTCEACYFAREHEYTDHQDQEIFCFYYKQIRKKDHDCSRYRKRGSNGDIQN